jgi:hypothetical protein
LTLSTVPQLLQTAADASLVGAGLETLAGVVDVVDATVVLAGCGGVSLFDAVTNDAANAPAPTSPRPPSHQTMGLGSVDR